MLNDPNVEVVIRALCALKKIDKCLRLYMNHTLLLFLVVLKQPSLFSAFWESLNKYIVALEFTFLKSTISFSRLWRSLEKKCFC